MSYTVKLLIPIGLGILAAVINWMILSAQVEPVDFITVNRTIPVGQLISPDDLLPLELPAKFRQQLSKTAVPYEDRGLLSGQTPRRTLEPGDIVLYQDTPLRGPVLDLREGETAVVVPLGKSALPTGVLVVGQMVSFRIPVRDTEASEPGTLRWVDPFRLVTVGGQRTVDRAGRSSATRIEQVSVAFKDKGTDQQRHLEEYLDRLRRGDGVSLSIQVHATTS